MRGFSGNSRRYPYTVRTHTFLCLGFTLDMSGGGGRVSSYSHPSIPISPSPLLHKLDDGEGNLVGSRTFSTMIMDYICQRPHVIQPLKLPIHLHIGMEGKQHLVDIFFHPLSFTNLMTTRDQPTPSNALNSAIIRAGIFLRRVSTALQRYL